MLRAGYNHWCKDQFLVRVSSLRHHCHVTASPVMLITMVTMVSRIQKCRTNKIIGLEKMFRTPPPKKKKKKKEKGWGWMGRVESSATNSTCIIRPLSFFLPSFPFLSFYFKRFFGQANARLLARARGPWNDTGTISDNTWIYQSWSVWPEM